MENNTPDKSRQIQKEERGLRGGEEKCSSEREEAQQEGAMGGEVS